MIKYSGKLIIIFSFAIFWLLGLESYATNESVANPEVKSGSEQNQAPTSPLLSPASQPSLQPGQIQANPGAVMIPEVKNNPGSNPTTLSLTTPQTSRAPNIVQGNPNAVGALQALQEGEGRKPSVKNAPSNINAVPVISRSLMFQYSDYDKIDRLRKALIARKRAVAANPQEKKGADVLDGILSKLAPIENKVVVKDVRTIYLSSLIYTGANTGMAWINSQKYNLGDDKGGVKLITVDPNSALIAWKVQNPETDLSQIAALLDDGEGELDLTKSAQGETPRKEKKKKRDDIIALDEKDRIVSIRLRPNQSFDTVSLTVNEGKTAPKTPKKPMNGGLNSTERTLEQKQSGTTPINPQPLVSPQPSSVPNAVAQPLPPSFIPQAPQVVNPSQNPTAAVPQTMPPVKTNEVIDIDSIINKDAIAPTSVEKKLPEIKMEDSPNQQKLPSVFDKKNKSFYNQDEKPNVPSGEGFGSGNKLLHAPQSKENTPTLTKVTELPVLGTKEIYAQTERELLVITDSVAKPIIEKAIQSKNDDQIASGVKELRAKGKTAEANKLEEFMKLGQEIKKSEQGSQQKPEQKSGKIDLQAW